MEGGGEGFLLFFPFTDIHTCTRADDVCIRSQAVMRLENRLERGNAGSTLFFHLVDQP